MSEFAVAPNAAGDLTKKALVGAEHFVRHNPMTDRFEVSAVGCGKIILSIS
jgi:hypothetical protein